GVLSGIAVRLPFGVRVGLGRPGQRVPLLHVDDLTRGLVALLRTNTAPGIVRIFDVTSADLASKQEFLKEYSRLSGQDFRQVWVPPLIVMAGARVLDAAFSLRGDRRNIAYKTRRLYGFEPRDLPNDKFWEHVADRPAATARDCIVSVLTPERRPALPSAEARDRLRSIAETMLRIDALKVQPADALADIVLVGAGRIAWEMHIPILKHFFPSSVKAVVDADLHAAQKAAAELEGAKALSSIQALDGDVLQGSTAVIATPGFTHCAIAQQLLECQTHLLLEKPAALTAQGFEAIRDAAHCSGRAVTVFQNYRLRPNVLKLWRFLIAHDVGGLVKASVVFHSDRVVTERARWSHEEKRNRVMVMELGIHFLDLACLVAGELTELQHVRVVDSDDGESTVSATGIARAEFGAEVYFDLDISGNSRRTQITLQFERCTCVLDFFPEGFRVLPEQVTPIPDIAAALKRLGTLAGDKLRSTRQGIHKRALPHLALYRHHFINAERRQPSAGFSLDELAPTMRSLFRIGDAVYGEYDERAQLRDIR
ncbi:MAG: Gfo/Idh/MocA family oxidoreductase, partial [Chloroflexi bacterium]|nr:Gfo/Idh/MocA family oxidoreductase [Chloroflexota bacterium]